MELTGFATGRSGGDNPSFLTVTTSNTDTMYTANDELYRKMSAAVPDLVALTSDAKDATEAEHVMTFTEGLRLYPKAIGWSMLLSLAIVMEGYDTILLAQFYALPEFKKHY